jgi:hypothetical protein
MPMTGTTTTTTTNYQPAYTVTLRSVNDANGDCDDGGRDGEKGVCDGSGSRSGSGLGGGRKVRPNTAVVDNPKYSTVLFGKLTQHQERMLQYRMLRYWFICWTCIVLNSYFGVVPLWFTCVMVAYCCLNHAVVAHDNMHLRSRMPMHLRMVGFGLWCSGYMPLACTYGDIEWEHIKDHHSTKGVLDRSENDLDSMWSDKPMIEMFLRFFVYPSHTSGWDIIFHQYLTHPAELWPERVAANIVHWVQLYLLYQTGIFWTVLFVGHCTMALTWFAFHGLLHRPSFYKFLIESDPSGARMTHPIIEVVCRLISEHAWMDIKWHDVHHSHGRSVLTYASHEMRGVPMVDVETALADLVDEGLFVDADGKGVSPISIVGHKIGSRKAYLEEKKKMQQFADDSHKYRPRRHPSRLPQGMS